MVNMKHLRGIEATGAPGPARAARETVPMDLRGSAGLWRTKGWKAIDVRRAAAGRRPSAPPGIRRECPSGNPVV